MFSISIAAQHGADALEARGARSFQQDQIARFGEGLDGSGGGVHVRHFDDARQTRLARAAGEGGGVLAHGEELANAQFGGVPAHFGVGGFAVVAKFGHVTEDRNAAAFAGERFEDAQGGDHGVGVGVISVVEDADAADLPELESHFGGLTLGQAALNLSAVQTEFRTERKGKKGIGDLVSAEEVDTVIAIVSHAGCVHRESSALFVEAHAADTPVVARLKTNSHDCGARSSRQLIGPRVVAIEKEASIRGQQFRQPAFFVSNTGKVAEELEVLAANVGNDAVAGLDHFHQGCKLAGMVGASFEDGGLMAGIESQEGERNANVVVEACFTRERGELLPKDGSDEFFGGGLAVGAGDGDGFGSKLLAVGSGEAAEGASGIDNANDGALRQALGPASALDEHCGHTAAGCGLEEMVPIKAFTRDGDEEFAGARLA